MEIRASRRRLLRVGASILLTGGLLAAGAAARAATTPQAHKVTVASPGPQTTNPLSARVRLAIKATDSAAGAVLTYTAAGLPPGLAIGKATGVIAGTVTTAYKGTVKVTVTDRSKATGSASFAWTAVNSIAITKPAPQDTTVGRAVALAIPAADDDALAAPLRWTAAGLPAGLRISSADGVITGTPTTVGAHAVTVTVTDKTRSAARIAFSWRISNLVTVTAPGSERSTVGVPIAAVPVTATDSTRGAPLTFRAAGLPPGLTISASTGTISGIPTGTAASDTVTVTATDRTGATGSALIGWTVSNRVTVTAPKAVRFWLGIPAGVRISGKDSDPAQTLVYRATGLPAGVSISPATGVISGSPATSAKGTAIITATDEAQSVGTGSFSWSAARAISIADPGRVVITAGRGLDVPLAAADKAGREKVTLTATRLPPGVFFRQYSPLIYGWPEAGTAHVEIRAKGSRGSSNERSFTLVAKSAPDKGGTGQLRLRRDGKCLQDPGNKIASGTRPVLAGCVTGATERWTIAADGTVRSHGRCLDVTGTVRYAGKLVQLAPCASASPRQRWVSGTRGKLVNPASGLCLTAEGGTLPRLGTCRVKPYEQWTLPAQPILAAVRGSCADDHFSGGGNGNVVDMFACNGTPGQTWSLRPNGTIRAGLYSNKCLTAHGPLRAGTRIELYACSAGNQRQQWTVQRTGGLSSELRVGGVCLAVPSLTAPNAAQLVTAACRGSEARVHWHIG